MTSLIPEETADPATRSAPRVAVVVGRPEAGDPVQRGGLVFVLDGYGIV
jgi:hypothetical protein